MPPHLHTANTHAQLLQHNYLHRCRHTSSSSRLLRLPGGGARQPAHDPLPERFSRRQQRLSVNITVAAANKGGSSREDEILEQLAKMADKYILSGSKSPSSKRRRSSSRNSTLPVQGIHILLGCYAAVWLLTAAPLTSGGAPLLPLKLLSLDHFSSSGGGGGWVATIGRWLCPLTDAFLSPNSLILARNLFFGYMFGRVVENTESSGALWLTFVLSALGGSTAGLLLLPRRAPLQACAATAALFGLFSAASIFNRHKQWHWQRAFELCVLLPFVLQQMLVGHQGLTQWCSLVGFRLPGAWIPLLGGFLGAAAAAGVLMVVRALQSSMAAQRQQDEAARRRRQQQQMGGRGAGGGYEEEATTPVSVLLARAAAQLLKKRLGGA